MLHYCDTYDIISVFGGVEMTNGDRIKQRRLELGLSVDEVAAKLGKNRATVYRYENNDIGDLPTVILEPLSKILDCTPAYLMGWEKIEEKAKVANKVIEDERAMRLVKYYSMLTEEQKKNAEIFLKALSESNEK